MYAATTTFARTVAKRAMVSRAMPSTTMMAQRSYHENIVEHYENPRNVGSLDKNDENVGTVRYYIVNYAVWSVMEALLVPKAAVFAMVMGSFVRSHWFNVVTSARPSRNLFFVSKAT